MSDYGWIMYSELKAVCAEQRLVFTNLFDHYKSVGGMSYSELCSTCIVLDNKFRNTYYTYVDMRVALGVKVEHFSLQSGLRYCDLASTLFERNRSDMFQYLAVLKVQHDFGFVQGLLDVLQSQLSTGFDDY